MIRRRNIPIKIISRKNIHHMMIFNKCYLFSVKSSKKNRRGIRIDCPCLTDCKDKLDKRFIYIMIISFFSLSPKKRIICTK